MFFWLRRNYGNASALHFFGQRVKYALTSSRQTVADYLNCSADNIVFTASATEANNLVIKGCWRRLGAPLGNIIISAIEHKSVELTAKELEKSGVEVRILPVKKDGMIDLGKLYELLDEKTFLVSIMYVNNETGVIQPLKEAVKIVADYNKEHRQKIYFHTDAVQAMGYLPCQPDELGVDFLTFSGHKIYGPQGVGCLYAKKRESLEAQIAGGGQEYGLRQALKIQRLSSGWPKRWNYCG
jgi:cysteine desulfurase